MSELTPEGFYRIELEGMPGVGCCRHDRTWADDDPYERWNIMYCRAYLGEAPHIMFTGVSSRDRSYAELKIGKRIPGLPTSFAVKERP